MSDSEKYRPLMGGIQVEARKGLITDTGSLGCAAVTTNEQIPLVVILSCAHVFGTEKGALVGQPALCGIRSCCKSNEIGNVLRGRWDEDIDAAIATIYSTLENPKAQICGLGGKDEHGNLIHVPIADVRPPLTAQEIMDRNGRRDYVYVRIRGAASSQPTTGFIDARRDITQKELDDIYLFTRKRLRTWRDQYVITSAVPRNSPPGEPPPFAIGGDSGSVVVDDDNKVVGLCWAGGGRRAFITPIENVLKALDIKILTATVGQPVTGRPGVPNLAELVDEAGHTEALNTPVGKAVNVLFERHVHEVFTLARTKPRVAVIWRRNGGPELAQTFVDSIRYGDLPLPSHVNGQPVAICIRRILDTFSDYGSAALCADIERYRPLLVTSDGSTVRQIIGLLTEEL